MNPSHIIGLVGTPGSGKSFVSDYILEYYGGEHIKFSDYLSHVLKKMALDKSRENMIKLSVILRTEFGDELLSHAVASDAVRSEKDIVLIDGIRRIGDLSAFTPLPSFKLIAVNADPKIRYERMKHRGEKIGETDMTWEEFEREEKASTEITIPETMTRADYSIMNNGTAEELKKEVDFVMEQIGIKKIK